MKLKQKDKYLLVICGIVCAFMLFMKGYYYPQQKTIRSMNQKISGKSRQIDRVMSSTPDSLVFEKDKQRVDKRIKAIRSEIARKMYIYPHVDLVGDLVSSLTYGQVPEKTIVRAVKLSKRKENESMRQLTCEMTLAGEFQSLYEYVHNLESLTPAVSIDWLDLRHSFDRPEMLVLEISLSCLFARPQGSGSGHLPHAVALRNMPPDLFKRLARIEDPGKKKQQILPTLKGIMSGASGRRVAVLDDQAVLEGDRWKNMELKKILDDRVIVSIGGVETTVTLDKEAQ